MREEAGFTFAEVMVVVTILGVLFGLAAGPFSQWYKNAHLEDRASTLHEAWKSAQARASAGGEADVANGAVIRQWMYVAVNPVQSSYRVVAWRDANANMIKEPAEFALLQEGNMGAARYGVLPSVTKGVTNADSSPAISTFSESACPDPTTVPLFAGYQCARFNGNGFLSVPAGNADIYITDGRSNLAVSINRAGIPLLYRWTGSEWQVVR